MIFGISSNNPKKFLRSVSSSTYQLPKIVLVFQPIIERLLMISESANNTECFHSFTLEIQKIFQALSTSLHFPCFPQNSIPKSHYNECSALRNLQDVANFMTEDCQYYLFKQFRKLRFFEAQNIQTLAKLRISPAHISFSRTFKLFHFSSIILILMISEHQIGCKHLMQAHNFQQHINVTMIWPIRTISRERLQ